MIKNLAIIDILKILILVIFPGVSLGGLNFSDRLEQHQLDNGLKIILIEDKRSPVVVSSIWYKVGSSYEYDGVSGISHILEHMMFKGTKNTEPGEFSRLIKKVGGSENAFTGRDFTGYYQKIHRDYLELALRLESDRMTNLVIKKEELKNEIEVVKEERRLRTDDQPTSKLFERISIQAFGMRNYGIPIVGLMKDINEISVNDLEKWYDSYYSPNNATLIIAGDFNPVNALSLVKKYYGSIPRKNIKSNNLKTKHDIKYNDISIKDKISRPLIVLSFKKQPFSFNKKKDSYALDLLLELMDGGNSSRFTKNLIENEKIAIKTFISYDTYSRQENLISIGGSPRKNVSPEKLKNALINQFEKFVKNGLVADELKNAKSRLLARSIYDFDSVFYQVMQVGMLESKNYDWKLLDNYFDEIDQITEDDLMRAAKIFILENKYIYSTIEPIYE